VEGIVSITFDDRKIALGLWIDEDKKTVLNEGYFRTLNNQHIDEIAIMIDASDRKWKSSWTPKDIEQALKLALPYQMEIILTVWPYPSREWMSDAFADLSILSSVGPVAAIEGDLEGNWTNKHIQGFVPNVVDGVRKGSLDVAGDVYVKMLDSLCAKTGMRKEMTTFTSHTENGRAADVAPHMDCLLVQAYSVRTRPDGHGGTVEIPWTNTYAPGFMQKHTFDRTMLIPGVANKNVKVGYGHALWNQEWPGHTPQDAMRSAMEAALIHTVGISRVRCWSSKWRDKNKYATTYLESLGSYR
jgi:hypothetical protein